MSALKIEPWDEHNQKLISNVHPADWQNPSPDGQYNLVVIGAGTGGLVSAAGAAGLGAKVALIERHMMGGDCLNVGCVPSKAMIASAHVRASLREAEKLGFSAELNEVDFAKIMARMREIRARISPHDSFQRFKDLGIDVYQGDARFTDANTIEVNGAELKFNRAIIATGARASLPNIPGLAEAEPLTNENVFNLTELPKRLAVIGGGPIGCELAQSFRRYGAEVRLFEHNEQLLGKEDADATAIVQQALETDGVEVVLNARLQKVSRTAGETVLQYEHNGQSKNWQADAVLVSAGRTPNVDGLGLTEAGVEYDQHGITVDDRLQTSNSKVYAVGDVCMRWKFTHAADAAARIAIQNALFFGRKKLSDLVMPWTTYTDPEVAQVGLNEQTAEAQGIAIDTYLEPMSKVDRAMADAEENGFVKIHVKQGSDEIVGATIVARRAGDMLNEITFAMTHGKGLGAIASTIHCYPTQGEAIKHVGDAYNRTRLTAWVSKLFAAWFKFWR